MLANWFKGVLTVMVAGLAMASLSHAASIAYDGFDYAGNLNGKNGGSGFGGAWTAVRGQNDPALDAGSLAYSDGSDSIATVGNKLQPASKSRSTRNFSGAITTANQTYWVSFRANQTDTGNLPNHHAGFHLYSGTGGAGNPYIFLGKPGSATNWGIDHSDATWVQRSGNVTTTGGRDAFLVYKLVFTSSQVTVSMWVNPILNEGSLGTAHATLTASHTASNDKPKGGGKKQAAPTTSDMPDIQSMNISIGNNAVNFQFDEFRMGTSFAEITPPPSGGGAVTLKVMYWNIFMARGTDNIRDFDRTAATIAAQNPDIVGLSEVMIGSTFGGTQLLELETRLEALTGVEWYRYWVVKHPGGNEGNGILSRHPFVPGSETGLFMSYDRSAARVQIEVNGKVVDFIVTHLDHLSSSNRSTQISELLTWAANFPTRRIIVGDFNAQVESSEVVLMTESYWDAWGVGYSADPVISTGYPDNTTGRTRRFRIDFIFYNKAADFVLQQVRVPDLRDPATFNGTPVGDGVVVTVNTADDKGVRPSDHNLVIATLQIP